MSQSLDYSMINSRSNDKDLPFAKAMKQRAIKISNLEYKHLHECPKDCKYIKEHILVQLRVCEDQCENNSRYKKLKLKSCIKTVK